MSIDAGKINDEMKRYCLDVLNKGSELRIDMPCLSSMRERIELYMPESGKSTVN